MLLRPQALMSAPNLEDPLAADIAEHYKKDPEGALKMAREWTARFASS
jgi:ubiquitin-conjugating enzyme E2 N